MHNNGKKLLKKLGLGRITRRQFIQKTAVGAAGVILTPWPGYGQEKVSIPGTKSRVVVATHTNIVDENARVNAEITRKAVDETLVALTQKPSVKDAWMAIFPKFKSTDIIGLKINAAAPLVPSRPEVVYAIANSIVDSLGINPNNIIIWERDDQYMIKAGYQINKSEKGIRCFGTVPDYKKNNNVVFDGTHKDYGVGYDEKTAFDAGDGVMLRVSGILSGMCDHLINVPVLKDHGLTGVVISLKNNYGSIDLPANCHGNRCDPYIANINAVSHIKDKTRLIICDALIGIYDGGPIGPPQWINRQLLASLDPVALDYEGMLIIDKKREEHGKKSVIERAVHIQSSARLGVGTSDPEMIERIEVVLG